MPGASTVHWQCLQKHNGSKMEIHVSPDDLFGNDANIGPWVFSDFFSYMKFYDSKKETHKSFPCNLGYITVLV